MTSLAVIYGFCFASIAAIVPYFLLGSIERRRYAIADVALYACIILMMGASWRFGVRIEPNIAFSLFVTSKLALFAAFSIRDGGKRWSPNIAAAILFIVYALLAAHNLQWPIDGDEPYYVLTAESILRDGDFDLRNQYAAIGSSIVRRPDLKPQLGDPVGRGGAIYSRHEPLLSFLVIPGMVLGGLFGATLTIAIFGALTLRSILCWLEEEEVSLRSRKIVFFFVAIGAPVLFYSLRIWPEIPAAFCLIEAIRALKHKRWGRFVAAIAGLALLKLRFVAIAVVLVAIALRHSRSVRLAAALAVALVLPFAVGSIVIDNPLFVHHSGELASWQPSKFVRGLFGVFIDGQTGIAFQAPFYLLGIASLALWKELPLTIRQGFTATGIYVLLLLPRDEWHGGWAPPLRYLVVFMPLLAVAAAWMIDRFQPSAFLLLSALWTAALTAFGIAFPWKLFHIANGESSLGEWLSRIHQSDVSRLLPSFIRVNASAWMGSILLVIGGVLLVARLKRGWRLAPTTAVGILSLAIALGVHAAQQPGGFVHLEDAHVAKGGDGSVDPHIWTAGRFRFTGGWKMEPGAWLSFRMQAGPSVLRYKSPAGARLTIDGRHFQLPPTGDEFEELNLELEGESHRITCAIGSATLDRIAHE